MDLHTRIACVLMWFIGAPNKEGLRYGKCRKSGVFTGTKRGPHLYSARSPALADVACASTYFKFAADLPGDSRTRSSPQASIKPQKSHTLTMLKTTHLYSARSPAFVDVACALT